MREDASVKIPSISSQGEPHLTPESLVGRRFDADSLKRVQAMTADAIHREYDEELEAAIS